MLCYYGDDMEEYRRWEDNIKMDLKEIGVNVMSWMELAVDICTPCIPCNELKCFVKPHM